MGAVVRRVARLAGAAAGVLLPVLCAAAAQPPAPLSPGTQPAAIAPPARLRVGEPDAMVLVVATTSPATELDAIDLKRLFLGIPVVAGGSNLRGVLNFSDPRLRDLFYEHVMGMAGSIYERRTLELTLEQGRRMPTAYEDEAALLALLGRDAQVVTFTWRSHVLGRPGMRIVRELWRP
jgi:hypothetical protein